MLVTIAIVIGILLAALLGYAAILPGEFETRRSGRMQAPPERIYPLIADFHKWASWSPFEKVDPAASKTFSGAPSGKGAVYTWSGNSQAGAGRMEIVETAEPSLIRIQLDFSKPFDSHNVAEFTISSEDGDSEVSWAMRGRRPYMMKLMSVFMNLDKLVGRSFEEGLASLKTITESTQSFSTKGA